MMSSFKILVRAPNWIGDQILAYPFFYYLREAYPKAHITSVCVDWVEDIQFKNLIDEVYVLSGMKEQGFASRFLELTRHGRILKTKGPWDLSFSLPNSFSAAWLLYRSEAKKRIGYSQDFRGFLLNEKKEWAKVKNIHRSQAYLELLGEKTPTLRALDFWSGSDAFPGHEFNPQSAWKNSIAVEPPSEKYWICAPGATAESRRWSIDQFVLLAKKIKENFGWTGVLIGGAKEAPLASYLCDDPVLGIKDFTARGPVTCLWKIFQNAQFTVCNESGLAHFASLCGSKVQIICGAADPKRTKPIGPGEVSVKANPVECWPCERNICIYDDHRKLQCLRGIKPDEVWESIQQWF